VERIARWAVLLMLGVFAALWTWVILSGGIGPFLSDVDAYWEAGLRLRSGEPLYSPQLDPDAAAAYRYAPWFAWLWIPLTFLPQPIAYGVWGAVVVVSFGVLLWPIRGHAALLLIAPLVLSSVWVGNVQAPMIALLILALGSRAEPAAIAIAASLKAAPILFALVYLGRRDWGRLALTLALTLLLVAPMLLYDLAAYPLGSFAEISLFGVHPVAWATVAVVAAAAVVWLARTRHGWLAAGVAVIAALPRLLLYEVSFLVPAVAARGRESRAAGGQSRGA
jgi:hypothetical protein